MEGPGGREAAEARPLGKAVHSHQMRSLEELQRLVSTEVEAKELALRQPELAQTVQAALRGLAAVEGSLRALSRHVAREGHRGSDPRMAAPTAAPQATVGRNGRGGGGGGWGGDEGSGSDGELGISGWEGTVRKGARGTILPADLASLPIAPAAFQTAAADAGAEEEEDFDAADWGLEEGFAEAVVGREEAQVHFLPAPTAAEERAMRLAADQHRHMRYWERESPALDPNLIRRMGIVLVAANAKRIAKQQKEARRQAGIVFEETDLVREPRRRSPVHRMAARGACAAVANEDDFADGIGDDDLELSLANFGKGKSSSSTESGSEDWDATFDEDFSDGDSSVQGSLTLPKGGAHAPESGDFDDDFDFPDD